MTIHEPIFLYFYICSNDFSYYNVVFRNFEYIEFEYIDFECIENAFKYIRIRIYHVLNIFVF